MNLQLTDDEGRTFTFALTPSPALAALEKKMADLTAAVAQQGQDLADIQAVVAPIPDMVNQLRQQLDAAIAAAGLPAAQEQALADQLTGFHATAEQIKQVAASVATPAPAPPADAVPAEPDPNAQPGAPA